MSDEVHWIEIESPGRLGTMPRPRGGGWLEWDLRRFHSQGVTALVSLLQPDETIELELDDEANACREVGLGFHHLPIPDRETPRDEVAYWSLAEDLHDETRHGASLAVHCRAGIGRATLMAGAVLVVAGVDPEEALARIATARGLRVPDTPEQARWFQEAARRRA